MLAETQLYNFHPNKTFHSNKSYTFPLKNKGSSFIVLPWCLYLPCDPSDVTSLKETTWLQRKSLEMMEGWDKPPSHAWHLSRRRCHGDGLLCKLRTQPPEMQPDIQEGAITPSVGQSAAAPSWSRETTARSSDKLYKFCFLSCRDIKHPSDRRLERVHGRPEDMLLKHQHACC